MTIIIPVDFSSTSLNAAHFAAKMLPAQTEASLILYHVYQEESEEQEVSFKLRSLKEQLLETNLVKVEWLAELSYDFIESLDRKVRHLNADLIVMSISEKSKLEQVVDPSNSLRMIEKNLCPVLVIPPDVSFHQIKNVAVASDFKNVQTSIPIVPVKRILSLFNAGLHIVNVNSEIYVSLNEGYLEQRTQMLEMFKEFNPEFYFITAYDFHDALRQFIKDKNIDLVLTFPRKHSFINNLFKGSNTKKLVYESSIPVLAAHE